MVSASLVPMSVLTACDIRMSPVAVFPEFVPTPSADTLLVTVFKK